jgi:hypothetical protein
VHLHTPNFKSTHFPAVSLVDGAGPFLISVWFFSLNPSSIRCFIINCRIQGERKNIWYRMYDPMHCGNLRRVHFCTFRKKPNDWIPVFLFPLPSFPQESMVKFCKLVTDLFYHFLSNLLVYVAKIEMPSNWKISVT